MPAMCQEMFYMVGHIVVKKTDKIPAHRIHSVGVTDIKQAHTLVISAVRT